MNKAISRFLVFLIVIAMLSVYAFAEETTATANVTEEGASIIAEYFVRDFQSVPETNWTSGTEIANTVTLYDETGAISAYSFELVTGNQDTGYIVISAYPDMPGKILEFSDREYPTYTSLNLSRSDVIVYTGSVHYYKKTSSGELTTIDGKAITQDQVQTPLSNIRSQTASIASKYPITNPITWANTYYTGPFAAYEWENTLESYCDFICLADISYENCSGPVAIANMVRIIGNYYNNSTITDYSNQQLLRIIADLDDAYFNNIDGLTYPAINMYIEAAFKEFGCDYDATSSTITYARIKNAIDANRPFYLQFSENTTYGDYAACAYAYTRLQSSTTGDYLSFVKIADGETTGDRYYDITSLQQDTTCLMRTITP